MFPQFNGLMKLEHILNNLEAFLGMKRNEYGLVHNYMNNYSMLFQLGIIALPISIAYRITSLCVAIQHSDETKA
jgi:hypothetical protein